MANARNLIAVDIGNSRIKFGLFDSSPSDEPLPCPSSQLSLWTENWDRQTLELWLPKAQPPPRWCVASVNRPAATRVLEWLSDRGEACELTHQDLALDVRVESPDLVGIDRLLGAVGVNRLRAADRPAIVIDLGSALTVDLVGADGAFLGGAILPGIAMSARALYEFTDRLPEITMDELADPPPALGTSTVPAMRSGLYWGAIGAMKELTARLTTVLAMQRAPLWRAGSSGSETSTELPEIFLTGGAAPIVTQFLDPETRFVPHLILGAIALVALRRFETATGVWRQR
jgi:type III pantothenate kinase